MVELSNTQFHCWTTWRISVQSRVLPTYSLLLAFFDNCPLYLLSCPLYSSLLAPPITSCPLSLLVLSHSFSTLFACSPFPASQWPLPAHLPGSLFIYFLAYYLFLKKKKNTDFSPENGLPSSLGNVWSEPHKMRISLVKREVEYGIEITKKNHFAFSVRSINEWL